jgi:hypothetical protein
VPLRPLAFTFALLTLACGGRSVDPAPSSEAASGESGESGSAACVPILQEDASPSGFLECPEGGTIVRESAQSCVDPTPPDVGSCNAGYGECSTAEDCSEEPYGACQLFMGLGAPCLCTYGCRVDADCEANEICMCAPLQGGSICAEAECRSNADCEDPERCVVKLSGRAFATPSLSCEALP